MTLVILFIGVILVVTAIRDTQGSLFSALGTDVPGFVVWAAAIIAIGAIGFIPGLKPVSKGLLALVLIVIVLRNYQGIVTGFTNAWQSNSGTSSNASSSTSSSSSSTSATISSTNANEPVPLTIPGPGNFVPEPSALMN